MTQTAEPEFAPARLAVLLQHFAEIDDERENWRVAYPLAEVLLLVTCATVANCDDFEMIVTWGEHNLDFLRRFSEFYHGVPCARWLRDLMNRINPALSPVVSRSSSLRCGQTGTTSSRSTARPPGAPTTKPMGSRPCIRSAPMRPAPA